IEIKPSSRASKRARQGSNKEQSGLRLRLARLTDDVGQSLELLRVEARQQLGDLLERAQHALLQRRPSLGRARDEHGAAIAAVRDAPDQRLILQGRDGAGDRRCGDVLSYRELRDRNGLAASNDAQRAQALPGEVADEVGIPEAARQPIERQDSVQHVVRERFRLAAVSGRHTSTRYSYAAGVYAVHPSRPRVYTAASALRSSSRGGRRRTRMSAACYVRAACS